MSQYFFARFGIRGVWHTARSENGSRRACSRSSQGAAERDTAFQRTGRLAQVAGRTEDAGHATRPSELAPIGSELLAWPFGTHTPPKPHIALRRAPPYVDVSVSDDRRDRRLSTSNWSYSTVSKASYSESVLRLHLKRPDGLIYRQCTRALEV